MGHNQHGHTLLGQILHNIENVADHFRVKGRSRLIKEHDVWVHSQTASNSDPLLLTAGQTVWTGISLISQAHLFQELHSQLICLVLSQALVLNRSKGDIFQNSHVREEVEVLEDHTDIFTDQIHISLLVCQIKAINRDSPAGHFL